jgi:hypothetical protein
LSYYYRATGGLEIASFAHGKPVPDPAWKRGFDRQFLREEPDAYTFRSVEQRAFGAGFEHFAIDF